MSNCTTVATTSKYVAFSIPFGITIKTDTTDRSDKTIVIIIIIIIKKCEYKYIYIYI